MQPCRKKSNVNFNQRVTKGFEDVYEISLFPMNDIFTAAIISHHISKDVISEFWLDCIRIVGNKANVILYHLLRQKRVIV